MSEPIIDREEAVALFRQMLDPTCDQRYLRLVGDAKMGKSHLLTKVFPRIASEAGARCFVLDLRNSNQTVLDLLHIASGGLGCDRQGAFGNAYNEWLAHPRIQANGLKAFLSLVTMHGNDDSEVERRIVPRLTRAFVDDVRELTDRPIVLIFDAVEQANTETQTWLMDTLLVHLGGLPHVHVVVGGRTLPDAAGSYHPICSSYELCPVEEEELYIRYCEAVGASLDPDQIRAFAVAINYVPGQFVDLIPNFLPGGTAHGR